MIKKTETVHQTEILPGMTSKEYLRSDAFYRWEDEHNLYVKDSIRQQEEMDAYYQKIADVISKTSKRENIVYSPLNIYLAISLFAEITAGETRAQILKALNVKDIDTLRSRVKALWNANCLNQPFGKSIPANSLWLRNDITYNDEALRKLAEEYYVTSFEGEMGSDELNHELQKWTDQNTGGLLTDHVNEMKLDPGTVLGLVSALYFKAAWKEPFKKEETTPEIFHGTNGDTEVQMMHTWDNTDVYYGKHFKALQLPLKSMGSVYFFLPEKDVNAEDVLCDPETLYVIRNASEQDFEYMRVNISIPHFKTISSFPLQESMEWLGITDAFDPASADFSPLTDNYDPWINNAEHTATVEINEDGVLGATFTRYQIFGAGFPDDEIDFVLDRPFCFAVVASDKSILFSGVVQTID